MKAPPPVLVAGLFPGLLEELLHVLRSLSAEQWQQATACPGWSVHDVALHLLADDAGILSGQRDGYYPARGQIEDWDELVAFINERNEQWVAATRRISPRLIVELLAFTGPQVTAFFQSRDPLATGGPVNWAGPEPAPVWLDLAREYTERWLHQQHIREGAGVPLLDEPRYLGPVLATFVHALPVAYEEVKAPEGTVVVLVIPGPAGGEWAVRREGARWRLYQGSVASAAAIVSLPAHVAWRLFTRGISREAARAQAETSGDERLAARLFETISILA
jgi:uncharacterized protein (TIGR03083 family)